MSPVICDKNRTHTSLTLKYNWETDTCPALPGVVVSVSYESDKKWCPDWYFSMQILRHTWHIFCSIPFNFDWTDETLNLMNWSNINLDELQRRWRNCGTLSCTASATTRCWASWARYMADYLRVTWILASDCFRVAPHSSTLTSPAPPTSPTSASRGVYFT